MLKQEDINKILSEFDNLKKEIKNRKQELNRLNSQKESWFKRKKEVSSQIFSRINELRSSKSKVANIDKEVKVLKDEKNTFSGQIGKLISEVKELKQKYQDECNKHGITDSPGFMKKKIDKVEFALETSAIGFEQEKRLNKELKKMKKVYAQMSEVGKIWGIISKREKEISALKNKKFGTLDKLKEDNTQKYGLNENFISNSQEIMDLKKVESGHHDKFIKLKEEFKEKNEGLKELLKKKDELMDTLDDNNVVIKDIAKKAEEKIIKEKSAEVKEKIKKKEKLTTEDLLIFQSVGK